MPYLNEAERDKLLSELVKLDFGQARRKLRRMDPHVRLDVFRNMQRVNEFVTRYELASLGTVVTLIEKQTNPSDDPTQRIKVDFELDRVVVQPMPENRT